MKSSALRQISLYALSLGIAACGAGDGSAPSLPTSPQGAPAPGATAPDSSTEISMPVTSEGAQPAGFKAVYRVDPKPDTEGIIRGDSPLTVQFDACGSRTDADKTLTYLFDWDFDHRANVVGTGDACQQEHTYNLKKLPDATGNALFETGVCVVSGNPRVHGPETYFSCRTFRISLPVPPPPKPCAHGLCTQGQALVASCDACVASICTSDPFCCNVSWDSQCVGEVFSVCGLNSCGGPI